MQTKYSTNVLRWTAESTKDIIVHSGGTSSGKTYSILEYLIGVATRVPNQTITVVGQDIPNLRVGAYRDAEDIIYNSEYSSFYVQQLEQQHKGTRVFRFRNKSVIEFNSYDDMQDAKSGKRDFMFMNEANGQSYDIFDELQVRTTKKAIIDFNPTAEFWAHDKLLHRDDVDWFNSTWRDNPFISDSVRDKILAYEPTPENIARGTANKYRWEVYGLGLIGRLEGLVFENFEQKSSYPEEHKWQIYGLDFGYENDPTALVEVVLQGGELHARVLIYETKLTAMDICDKLDRLGIARHALMICDSARPESIEELNRKGYNARKSVKGKDDIIHGIDILKRYRINVYSRPLYEELSSYIWATDKDGRPTNRPVKKYDHAIDALRYATTYKIKYQKPFVSALI